VAFT
jgi:hypothetical protein